MIAVNTVRLITRHHRCVGFLSCCELTNSQWTWVHSGNKTLFSTTPPGLPPHTRTHIHPAFLLNLPSHLCCWLLVLFCGCSSATESGWMRASACLFYFYTSHGIGGAGSGWNLYHVFFFQSCFWWEGALCVCVYCFSVECFRPDHNKQSWCSLDVSWWIAPSLTTKQNISSAESAGEATQVVF